MRACALTGTLTGLSSKLGERGESEGGENPLHAGALPSQVVGCLESRDDLGTALGWLLISLVCARANIPV